MKRFLICLTCYLVGTQVSINAMIPLHAAAQAGDLELVDALLLSGADVNTLDGGITALHWAIIEGHQVIAQRLLAAGANVDVQWEGWAPLHLTAIYQRPAIAQLLLDAHANINLQNSDGNTPLHVAARNRDPEVAHIFLNPITRKVLALLGALHPRLGANSPANKLSHDIFRDIFQFLKNARANINLQNKAGKTPLSFALYFNAQIAHELLEAGANVNMRNIDEYYRSERLNGPTSQSLREQLFRKAAQQLLTAGTSIDEQNEDGKTLLHLAVECNAQTAAQMLIRAHANINLQDNDGNTPLHRAVEHGNQTIVQMLLTAGAHTDLQNIDFEMTPMKLADLYGKQEVVQLIKDHIAKPEMQAFTAALHPRVGTSCPARILPQDMLRTIFALLRTTGR